MWLSIRSGEQTGRVLEITGERFVVGRDEDCDLTLPDEKVSRKHVSLAVRGDGRVVLQDLGSTNGTFVDDRRVTRPVELAGTETVKVGDTLLLVSSAEPSHTPTTIGVMPAGVARPTPAPPTTPIPGVPPGAPPGPGAPPPGPGGPPGVPPGRTGLTTERMILRKAASRATWIGIVAAVLALVGIGVVVYFVAFAEDAPPPVVDEPEPEEVVDAVRPSTVLIDSLVDGQPIAGGTGWVLDAEQGLVVTNAHVVNGGETLAIGVPGQGGEGANPAEAVGAAPCEDLAVLKAQDNAGMKELPLGSQGDLKQGETVIALGFPASASEANNLSTTVGAVSVVQESFDLESLDVPLYPNVIRTDAAINPGNSGGPLVNVDGELVGVNSAGITLLGGRTIQGEAFAIGVDRVKEIVPTLAAGESIAWTGAGFEFPTSTAELTSLGLPAQPGLIISDAVDGSAAQTAGFGETPALLVAVNGRPVSNSLPSYCNAVEGVTTGGTVTFTVIEAGSSSSVDVEVGLE